MELLEGNTAVVSQYYYGCLFHELLAFHLSDRHPPAEVDQSYFVTIASIYNLFEMDRCITMPYDNLTLLFGPIGVFTWIPQPVISIPRTKKW